MLWDKTKQLPEDLLNQVKDYYRTHFPLDVRLHMATWIEEKFSPSAPFNPEDVGDQQTARNLAFHLMSELDRRIEEIPNHPDQFVRKENLTEISRNLKNTYSNDPVSLFMIVRGCLEHEMKIVEQGPERACGPESPMAAQIRQEIAKLAQNVQNTAVALDQIRQEQEVFSTEWHTIKEKNVQFDAFLQQHGDQHPEAKKIKTGKGEMEKRIKNTYFNLTNSRSTLIQQYVDIVRAVKDIQHQVLDVELIKWKRDQQLAGNGFEMKYNLEPLQEWCEGLADVIWKTRQQLRQLDLLQGNVAAPPNTINLLPELIAGITELLSNLVSGTFMIEKQPPQVMKTNTRFTATVRLLVGGKLQVHMVAPSVSVSIVSESQANQLITSPSNEPKRKEEYSSGDILNGHGTMEYHSSNNQVSVSFRNLQLKKIKRTEKRGTESVMDEKFSVLFWTDFQLGDLKFQMWTLSLPVVVIVHGNQEPQALATVTWDNAFAEWCRRPFVVPEKVTWAQAGAALNMKWKSVCGSSLTDDNLYFLACKAFRNNNLPRKPEEFNNLMLSWGQFCKETLPDRSFTFWEWFYRILILTSNHMQKLWKEGYVMGFVTKQAVEQMLLAKPTGTFLLRFSDSELGGVTIAYNKQDPYTMKPMVQMVAPFTTKDLSQRPMADVIFDLKDLETLYPETPKEKFRRFCSSGLQGQGQQQSRDGYIKHMLVTHVEGPISDSNPATPLGYDLASISSSHHEAQSPGNAGFLPDESMDFGSENININIEDNIDITQLLGDFVNQN